MNEYIGVFCFLLLEDIPFCLDEREKKKEEETTLFLFLYICTFVLLNHFYWLLKTNKHLLRYQLTTIIKNLYV